MASENDPHVFSGAPEPVEPARQKTAVTRSHRNRPAVNDDIAPMAQVSGMAVIPPGARHPEDKSQVENEAKPPNPSVSADIDAQEIHGLASPKVTIRPSLAALNDRRKSGTKGSRRDHFDHVEKDSLQPLPPVRFRMKAPKTLTP